MRARLLAPNLVTAANIVVGFLTILATADGRFELAVYLMLAAILLDMADGRLARRLGATSRFGQELDSFSDTTSFCVAPALLAQRAVLQPLGGLGVAVATAYLLSGVLRLVRFNITSDVHGKAARTVGVPTPIAAGYVMALVLMRDRVPAEAGALLVLVLAAAMLSRFGLPELRSRGLVGALMLVGIANYFAVVARPNWYTVAWWNLWNVVILLAARRTAREERGDVPGRLPEQSVGG